MEHVGGMKIVSVEAIPVRLPLHEPIRDHWGTFLCSNHGIVVIRCESGEYGVGEIALAWFGGAHSLCKEVNDVLADRLCGLEVTEMTKIEALLDQFCSFSKRHLLAKAGIEMALWDVLGKTLHQPIYKLLGGKLRETVPLTGGISMNDSVEHMVQTAVQRVAEGYKELKLKVGDNDSRDLETIRKIRNAVPDAIKLRVDANMAWKDAKKAKVMIDEMVQLGVCIVEQPLKDDRLDDLAWLRTNSKALILIDEGVWDVHDAKRNLDGGAADLLHIYISEAGGIRAAKRIFDLAELYCIDCTIGSMPEGRIGAAASAHVALAMPNLSGYASDIRGFTAYSEDVVNEELTITDGNLIVSDRPGLGVTLDWAKLDKLKIH